MLAARNILKAWLFLGGFAALLTTLGWWLGGLPLGSLFLVVALLMVSTLYWYGPRVILASLGARELLLAEAPLLHSSLERLAVAAGVDRPRLYVLPDGHPRAFAVGRGRGSAAVALSQGLVTLSRPAELEGLLAHELAHIRHRDVVVQTPVVVVAGWLLEASRIGGILEQALLFILAPVAASLVQVLLSPKREFAADAAAARYCTSPHGLADALVRLEQAQELVSFRASPVTEPLYTVNPFEPIGIAALFTTHPPVGERVERLRNLDPDWREKLRAA
ncbi:MAG TPA: M48 family metalloprotease [Gaiellaceae bacterium]|nr:M48 family metalloprotease [Gaiellaceae bacterium]